MKVQFKVFLAMVPTGIALLLIGMVAIRTVSGLGEGSQAMLRDNFKSLLAVQRMLEALEKMDSAGFLLMSGRKGDAETSIDNGQAEFRRELETEANNITEPGEQEQVQLLLGESEEFFGLVSGLRKLSPAEETSEYFNRVRSKTLSLKKILGTIMEMNQDAIVRKSDHAKAEAAKVNRFMLLVIIAASVCGILLSVLLARRILRPLSVLAQAVRRVGLGDLDITARIEGSDEIAQLAGEFNQMAGKLREYRNSSLGELLMAQQASQAAIDSLPDPVFVFDPLGNLINSNGAADSLGIEIVPLSTIDPSDPPTTDPVRKLPEILAKVFRQVLRGEAYIPKNFDEAFPHLSGGAEKFFLPRGYPFRISETIFGVTVVLQDITRWRRFDLLKNDLVSTVAHEFRTPLTSLRMAIHLLLEKVAGDLSPKQEELLFPAREDCERLHGLVEDFLDLSRIQSGRVRMEMKPLSARELVEKAHSVLQPLATESGKVLRIERPLPACRVVGDAEKLHLVFRNFVSNAVRHSPDRGVINLDLREEVESCRFEVRDEGPGIPTEFLGQLFEKFFRVPGTTGPGSGLGLSIAKEIVEAHGGRIGVESGPGKGSLFWFSLPKASEFG